MIGNWQWFWFLLVTVKCTWSLNQSEYGFYWGLLDDPYGNTFSADGLMHRRELSLQMTQTHKFGLPKCTKQQNECRNIGIVGAGIAGLYCGILLAQAGHTVTIFEANNRAGGRIFTYRDPINPSLYMGELGAMRFPLAIQPYLNTLIQQRYKLNVTQFINSNDNGYVYFNGIRATFREVRKNPDIFKFNTSQDEQGKSSDALWMNAMQPILKSLEQGGWSLARNQWDSYSADSYFNTIKISQGARDYMVLTGSAETRSHLSILAHVRSKLLTSSGSKYYRIQGGNDHLIEAMISECQSIESNRCSIQYSTPVTEIELYDSNQVQWKTKNATTNIFDRIIVATTPTAAQLIIFNPRIQFIGKYRALRQVHLSCATKILLFFNVSWWYTQEHINGGQSITDLNIRSVYYPYTTNNETNGGTILAGYIVGYSSILWQSLSDSDAIELALKELIQLHKSSSNLRDYFQGGKVQNWCGDSYAHGATTWFTPLQETRLFSQLKASISNVHFIGESTSLIQGWVEGSIVSALRGALEITTQEQKIFDVIIMGGNPVGLITAVFLSLKQPNLRIVIVEKGIASITLHQRRFQQIYNQEYLTELANMSVFFWRQLEELANMSLGSILNTNDGFLFFGDMNSSRSTINGDLLSIKRTCDNLKIDYEYLNSTQIETRYSFVTLLNHYQGIFHKQSGYINVTTLMIALFRIINQNLNIIIREQEEILSFELFDNLTQIITDRGVLYASRKVIFLPDTSLKNLSYLFNFNINVNLWELPIYYFRRLSTTTSLPIWLAFGDHNQYSVFSGFSIDPTSDYIIIKPNFIGNLSNPLIYPNQKTNIIDPFITQKVIEWVSRYMRRLVNVSDYYSLNQTYLSPFLPDNEYILDYIPGTNKRMLIQDSIIDMTFAPIWADILSDMTLFEINSSSKYVKYINYFLLPQSSKGYRLTYCLTVLYCLAMLYIAF